MSDSDNSMSSSNAVETVFLTKDEKEVLDLKYKVEFGKILDKYESKCKEVEEIYKNKSFKLENEKQEILRMNDEQKTKMISKLALRKGEEMVILLQKKKMEQKRIERQEQVKRNLEAFKEECQTLRNHNNGE